MVRNIEVQFIVNGLHSESTGYSTPTVEHALL